jgi:pantothenate kinase
MPIRYRILESGQENTVTYTRKTVKKHFLPLAEELAAGYRERSGSRFVIGVSGPPGSGKSAFSSVLIGMLAELGLEAHLLPLDGFHLKNDELKRRSITLDGRVRPLIELKGGKETYDVKKVRSCLEKLAGGESLYWPVYLRTVHEPVGEGIHVSGRNGVYIVEGNYLFLGIPPWKNLSRFFRVKLFILPKKKYLKERIVSRKQKGGYSREESLDHYHRSDLRNIREVLSLSRGYDLLIRQTGRYSYEVSRSRKPQRSLPQDAPGAP